MRFTMPADQLHSLLSRASYVTPSKAASLVAYTGVLFTVEDGQLSVTGSDGEITVCVFGPVENAAAGSVLVQPKRLLRWLSSLRKDVSVTVTADSTAEVRLVPESGQEYRFKAMVATFPGAIPAMKDMTDVDIHGLREALAAVRDAADEVAAGSSRQAVQLACRQGNVYLHSTDRVRLSRAVLRGASPITFTSVVELKALDLADRLGSTRLGVDSAGRTMVFEGEGHRMAVRTLDITFPPVDSVLDDTPVYSVKIPRADLKAALERLACVSDDTLPLVVEVDGHEVTLRTESAAVGGGRETLELSSPAPSMVEFGINLSFLISAVSSAAADQVSLGWSSPVKPVFVSSASHPEVTIVVMPIKLAE